MDAQALQWDGLGEAFAQGRGRAGMGVREFAGQPVQTFQRNGVIGELPSRTQLALDGGPVAFWELIEDISLLVAIMPTSA